MNQSESLRDRLLSLGSGPVSDALGKTGAMDHEIRPFSASPRMAGTAYTVRVHTADILMVAKALSECPGAAVLVIDGRGERNTALWGGLTTQAALYKGLAGVVVDGAIRDVAEIRRSELPVYARSVVPAAGGAEYVGELQVPVQCGGTVVHPGDWLVGDEDGVVVIPAARLDQTLQRAQEIVAAEVKIAEGIRQGQDFAKILSIDEILESKGKKVFIPQLRINQPGN